MGSLRSAFDVLVIIFFLTHIPITMLVDSQALFPRSMYPSSATKMMDDFLRDFGDPLMTPPLEPWFKSFVWTEVTVQLAFFFVGAYAFITRKNWVRIPAIIYGTFVVASMVPILTVLATHTAPGYVAAPLVAFYLPYLLVPAGLVAVAAANDPLFPPQAAAAKSKWS